jgi:hypothetical protein
MRFIKYLKEEVNTSDLQNFEGRWLSKLKSFGLTEFEFSKHLRLDRINHPRNVKPITIEDLDFVMDGFIRKMGNQLKKDIEDVKNHTAKKRGKNKQNIPDNNLEYTIKSSKTNIALSIALKQNFKQKGTAVIVPITIKRQKGWKLKQGIEVIVERRRLCI